jgi:hypothetical protein
MNRYFFHTEDGHYIADMEGTELPDLAAARCDAVQLLVDLLDKQPEVFWRNESFRVIVSDDSGITLFRIELSAVMAPALQLSAVG